MAVIFAEIVPTGLFLNAATILTEEMTVIADVQTDMIMIETVDVQTDTIMTEIVDVRDRMIQIEEMIVDAGEM